MTPSNEVALITNSTPGIALGFAIGASQGVTPYLQGLPIQPVPEHSTARSPHLEDHVSVEVDRLLEDVRRALNHDLSAAKTSAARLAAFLTSKLSLGVPSTPARGGLAPWQKRKIENCIENGLEGPLPVEGLAQLASLSPSYFCRAFKESFGLPPHAYVVRMRVERARTLMLTTSDSLSQIALACGLVDQAHLCKCFRQITGSTPGAWRRRHATGPHPASPVAISDERGADTQSHSFPGEAARGLRLAPLEGPPRPHAY
jgi:AraC family transcriptional regulator